MVACKCRYPGSDMRITALRAARNPSGDVGSYTLTNTSSATWGCRIQYATPSDQCVAGRAATTQPAFQKLCNRYQALHAAMPILAVHLPMHALVPGVHIQCQNVHPNHF
jgi:hypothetical protein